MGNKSNLGFSRFSNNLFPLDYEALADRGSPTWKFMVLCQRLEISKHSQVTCACWIPIMPLRKVKEVALCPRDAACEDV